jgi:hypothetical protein
MFVEEGHVEVMLWEKFSAGDVVDEYYPAFSLLRNGRERLAFLKRQFLCKGDKAGVVFE